jgi:uncharacterized protein
LKNLIFAVSILLLTSGVHAAGFDCTKASTFVEKAICSDTVLSKLDDLLMNSYKEALANVSNTEKLKSGQRVWLSNTRNKCPDIECLKDAYNKRIADINGIAASPDPVSNKVIKNAGSLWAGEWNRIDHSKHEEADMTITKNTSQGFEFSLIAFSGGNSGQLDGSASFVANFAAYKDSESGCIVEFRMKDKCIAITTEGCIGVAGLGVNFDGTYCKGKQKKKQTSNVFMDIGVFSNDSELKIFKKLVGKTYGLFEDSFQLVNEEADLDQLNAKVLAGGVRGLFTLMEGIIMHCPNGMLYAAVIDGDTVKYFSNDPHYSKKIPITIDRWRDRFKEKKVIYCRSE